MKKGFTLTELLVSISIIVILSSIGVQTYFIAQRNAKLSADVMAITSAIRQAQNRSLSPSRGDLDGIQDNEKLCAMGLDIVSPNTLQPFYKVEGPTGACDDDRNYGDAIELNNVILENSDTLFEFLLPFAQNVSVEPTIELSLSGSGVVSKTISVTDSGLINIQ